MKILILEAKILRGSNKNGNYKIKKRNRINERSM